MYQSTKRPSTSINVNKSYKGETIEQKVQRVTVNKEPIKDGAPLIYTDRKDGVQAAYDIRTDRFEVAVEAMDKVTGSMRAKRDTLPTIGEQAKVNMEIEKKNEREIGGTESSKGTETP